MRSVAVKEHMGTPHYRITITAVYPVMNPGNHHYHLTAAI